MSVGSFKQLALGVALLVSFVVVMVMIFMPLLDGDNALDYLDNLYNSISKGSAYYIPKVRHQVDELEGGPVSLTLRFAGDDLAAQATSLLSRSGAVTDRDGTVVRVNGGLEAIFTTCLEDAESAYHNRNEDLQRRYGLDARPALYTWWTTLGAMEKELNRQKLFAAAQLTHTVQAKTVECAYNYYGIEAQAIRDRWGTVLFSLVFYVLYTVWYGYGIMFTFEGLGFRLSAH